MASQVSSIKKRRTDTNPFQKTEDEGIHPRTFYETIITLIPKLDKTHVKVRVLEIDRDRRRISLTMKN